MAAPGRGVPSVEEDWLPASAEGRACKAVFDTAQEQLYALDRATSAAQQAVSAATAELARCKRAEEQGKMEAAAVMGAYTVLRAKEIIRIAREAIEDGAVIVYHDKSWDADVRAFVWACKHFKAVLPFRPQLVYWPTTMDGLAPDCFAGNTPHDLRVCSGTAAALPPQDVASFDFSQWLVGDLSSITGDHPCFRGCTNRLCPLPLTAIPSPAAMEAVYRELVKHGSEYKVHLAYVSSDRIDTARCGYSHPEHTVGMRLAENTTSETYQLFFVVTVLVPLWGPGAV